MSLRQYQHALTHYPSIYGVSYRTILRWAAKGFPLDDGEATRAALESGDSAPPGAHKDGPRSLATARAVEKGLPAALARLEAEEAQAHAAYRQAVEEGDERIAAVRRKEWIGINEALRKAAVSSPEVQEANRRVISLDDVSQALTELFVIHRQDLENLGKRIAGELVGKDEISIREVINREAAVIVESLHSCEYLGASNE